jgi:hypothetical protein
LCLTRLRRPGTGRDPRQVQPGRSGLACPGVAGAGIRAESRLGLLAPLLHVVGLLDPGPHPGLLVSRNLLQPDRIVHHGVSRPTATAAAEKVRAQVPRVVERCGYLHHVADVINVEVL